MMEKSKERDKTTKTNDRIKPGHVKQICQHFLVHSDSSLAYRLQQEEFDMHFDRNRTHRRNSRLGVKMAHTIAEEERRAFVTKQLDYYQQKKQIEKDDIALSQKLQQEMKSSSNPLDHTVYSYISDDQCPYEKIDHSLTCDDTSNDEQLAQILQEQEKLLVASAPHSHLNSSLV